MSSGRTSTWTVAGLIGVMLLASACRITIPPSEVEVENDLRRIASGVRPLPGELRVVALYASSRMDAWAQMTESVAEGEDWSSKQARRLTRAFSQAERRRVAVVTGGPYADLNQQIVRDALEDVKAQRLPGLTLVFVSPEPPTAAVREAVTRRGSSIVHRQPTLR